MKNPWNKVSTKEIYQNPWIRVREDQVIRPDGEPGIYSVVETRPAIGIVALTAEQEIYLIGQYRYPLDIYSWEIIEGGGETGETHIETARRELLEEAGIIAGRLEPLGSVIHLSNCFSDEHAYLFLATDLTVGPSNPDPDEVLALKKVKLTDAIKMLDCGEITDAMSIIAIQRLEKLYAR